MVKEVIALVVFIAIVVGAVLYSRHKSKRYGGYTDPVKVRLTPVIRTGFRPNRTDGLYDDDGRINRDWKP